MAAFAGAFVCAVGAAVTWNDALVVHSRAAASTRRVVPAVAAPSPAIVASPVPSPSPSPAPAPTAQALVAAAPAPPKPAPTRPPAVAVGSYQQSLVNQDRAAAGLPPLAWSTCLAGVARQQAARMAATGSVVHTDGISEDLGCGLGGLAGENLGYWTGGIDDVQLNRMFMASAEHRANILGSFRYIGTAWVVAADGTAYLAVEFAS